MLFLTVILFLMGLPLDSLYSQDNDRAFWCFNGSIFLNFISEFHIYGANAILMKTFFGGSLAIFKPDGSKRNHFYNDQLQFSVEWSFYHSFLFTYLQIMIFEQS